MLPDNMEVVSAGYGEDPKGDQTAADALRAAGIDAIVVSADALSRDEVPHWVSHEGIGTLRYVLVPKGRKAEAYAIVVKALNIKLSCDPP